MQTSLVSSFASMHIGGRPQHAISFKSSVGGRPLCGELKGHDVLALFGNLPIPLYPSSTKNRTKNNDNHNHNHMFKYVCNAAPSLSRTGVVANAFVVEAKQNSLRRQRTAERARQYNKARKSEIATRMKKVFVALDAFKSSPPTSEVDLAPVGSLMAEAYQVIDKAVRKGVLHENTGARRKSRLARARKNVLISAGLYTPQ